MNDITPLVYQLRDQRAGLAFAKAKLAASRQAWEEANSHTILSIALLGSSVENLEKEIREHGVRAWLNSGDKHPAPGLSVRLLTKLHYDPATAMNWAMEHKIALQLDTKTFESIAKQTSLPFVTTTTVPQATIATDLGAALANEPSEPAVVCQPARDVGTSEARDQRGEQTTDG